MVPEQLQLVWLSVRLSCRGTSAAALTARRECAVPAAARTQSSGSNKSWNAGSDTRIGPGNARFGPLIGSRTQGGAPAGSQGRASKNPWV